MNTSTTPTQHTSLPSYASRQIWLLLAAAFVAILNETTMGVAIPHLIDDLSITETTAQWLTTAFMLTMAVVIPTTGFMLQRFPTRKVFLTAISLFTAGTLIAFVAPSFPVLLVARIVQASGTAIMMPLLMTTTMTLVPAAMRGRFMGRISVVMSLAPAIGPTLAGFLMDTVGWHWIFGAVLPIAVAAMLAGAKWMVNVGEHTDAPLSVPSVVLSAFGFGGIVYGLSQVGAALGTAPKAGVSAADAAAAVGTARTSMVIALVAGVVALTLFIVLQLRLQRKDDALMDLRVFRSRNFTLSIIEMFLLSAAFFGAITVLPLYLQRMREVSALETGLIMLPGALLMGLLGPIIGRIYDARGPRLLIVPGSILAVGVLAFYSTLSTATPIWVIVIAQAVLSMGLAMAFTPLFTASLSSVKRHLYSHGSAVLSTIQQVAGAMGIAFLVAMMSGVGAAAVTGGAAPVEGSVAGVRAAFLIAAIIAAPTILLAFFIRKPDESDDVMPGGH